LQYLERMVLWIILALLTAAVAIALLYPLSRRRDQHPDKAQEVEVYRDQMKELERDEAQGLISPVEARYARAEIGRRLLAAASTAEARQSAGASRGGAAAAAVVILPPAIGLCLYIMMGNPGLPDQPLEARLADPGTNVGLLIAKVERHLAHDPNDGAGWEVVAPVYLRSMRVADAQNAYRNAIRILGPSSERLSGLGEALMAANDGIVTNEAREAFEQAVKLEAGNTRARFYVGIGLEQAGQRDEAKAAFEEIARLSPPDAPWMDLVNEHIAKNGRAPASGAAPNADGAAPSDAPGPTAADVASAANLSQDDRQAMIRGMVDGLAARLEAEPSDIEGWKRLIRSYMVLGERDEAEAAVSRGLQVLPEGGEERKQLIALAQEVGLKATGMPMTAPGEPEGVKR
jgi:cytochrome c-type biogenesis protein CcmH